MVCNESKIVFKYVNPEEQLRHNCPCKHPTGEVCALAGVQRSSLHPFSGCHFTTIWTRLWHVSTVAPGPNFLPSIILQQGWYDSLKHQQPWACVFQQAWAASGGKRGTTVWMSCDMKAGVRIHRCDLYCCGLVCRDTGKGCICITSEAWASLCYPDSLWAVCFLFSFISLCFYCLHRFI